MLPSICFSKFSTVENVAFFQGNASSLQLTESAVEVTLRLHVLANNSG